MSTTLLNAEPAPVHSHEPPGFAAPAAPKHQATRRIGLLLPSLEMGGAERVASTLANHWAQLGHSVTMMTFSDPNSDAFELGPTVRRVVIGGAQAQAGLLPALRKNALRWHRVRQQLQTSQLDVALSFLNVPNSCLALAGLGTRTVCIGSERSYPPSEVFSAAEKWARWLMYGALDAVVAQTEDTAAWLRLHTRAKTVVAIPNPVQLPLPSTQPSVNPQQWLRTDARVMVAIGRLNEGKRFESLIRAFAQASAGPNDRPSDGPSGGPSDGPPNAPQDTRHWQLVILGDGPLQASLQALVSMLGLQGRVCLPGRVGNVGDWLARADAFAMTSRYEGYPNALLEALASGVPAVACDVLTGPRELIQHGVNGLLVPDHSPEALTAALRQIMTEDTLRRRMATQAHSTLHSHAINTIVARWEAVFAQAITQRRTA
jgi:glycosyltransferase involved in cell wall biosynthesis